jgi:hypothetical protein
MNNCLNVIPNVSVTEIYTSCEDCLDIKNTPPCIKLQDCLTGEEILISFSETLESYVGKVIKLSIPFNNIFIEKCYTVNYSPVCPENLAVLPGILIDCFQTCEKCLPKCICTKALNNGNVIKKLTYVDCEGVIQQTVEDVAPGKYSLKYCVTQWIDLDVISTEVLEFGECINNTCPETIQPKKFIAPGYDTPACSPSKYEKIVCKYAELKYTETMNKRYGLNIQCNEEDLVTSTIKFELLQMQILNDPDYQCVANTQNNNCNC